MIILSLPSIDTVIKQYIGQFAQDDYIYDRLLKRKVHINNLHKLLNFFTDFLAEKVSAIKFDKSINPYRIFLKNLSVELGIDELKIQSRFENKYHELEKGEMLEKSILMMTLCSTVIETFQLKFIRRYSIRLQNKIPNINEEKLQHLFEYDTSIFSLIINIEVVKDLARVFGIEIQPVDIIKLEEELISKFFD